MDEAKAREIVQFAEDVHESRDVERMMECFHDDVVAYWNGEKIADGIAELRRWYHGFFDSLRAFTLKKTLFATEGDRIAVRWTHRRTDAEGRAFEGEAGEFWTLRGDRLSEWRAYCVERPVTGQR
jgi:nuclear transport factor 2 (NTF2) superfamily protein